MLSPKVTGLIGVVGVGALAYAGPGAQTATRRAAVTGVAATALVLSLVVGFTDE